MDLAFTLFDQPFPEMVTKKQEQPWLEYQNHGELLRADFKKKQTRLIWTALRWEKEESEFWIFYWRSAVESQPLALDFRGHLD